MKSDAKLILSSEWEFSPLTRTVGKNDLTDFVFIGLPASEAGNALIVPLAGHEIGHSVWQHHALTAKLKPVITKTLEDMYSSNVKELETRYSYKVADPPLQDLFVMTRLAKSLGLLNKQCEEIFCDLTGLLIFGESYLYSFLYLLAPNVGGKSSPYYPTLETRATYLEAQANKWGFEVPANFTKSFFESGRSPGPDDFMVDMADRSAISMVDTLASEAEELVAKKIQQPANAERDEVVVRFQSAFPLRRPGAWPTSSMPVGSVGSRLKITATK